VSILLALIGAALALIVGVAVFVSAVLSLLDSISKTQTLITHQRELFEQGYTPEQVERSVAELRKVFRATPWWTA
jgi:hypothetical protein